MKILKRIAKYIVGLVLIAVLGVIFYAGYKLWPSEFDVNISAGPNQMLSSLIAQAKKGTPINKDPYASSLYHPDNPLYKPLLAIQQKSFLDEENTLVPLVDQGNADAMFWLGKAVYDSSFFAGDGESGAKLFKRAAELGNPYAALMLDDTADCQMNMGWNCDSKWGELGRKLLKARALKGDAKAGFRLFKITERKAAGYSAFFKSGYQGERFRILLKAAEDGIKQHYYPPVLYLIDHFKGRTSLSPFNSKKVPLSATEVSNLFSILKIALNNNDYTAVFRLERLEHSKYSENTMERLLPFIGWTYTSTAFDYYALMAAADRSYAVRGFARAIAYENNGRDGATKSFNYNFMRAGLPPLSDKEKAQAKVLAKEYTKQNKPIIFIDENYTYL